MESENAPFWLPSQFLTDNNFLPVSNHRLPFDPFAPDTDSARDKVNDMYDDELTSALTCHLARSSLDHSTHQKSWNMSTSPQSTLTGLSSNGSPNGESPLLTPPGTENDVAWHLYQAVTQVARLKMAAQHQHQHHHINSSYNHSCKTPLFCFEKIEELKRQVGRNAMWGHNQNTKRPNSGGFNTLYPSAWLQNCQNLNHRDLVVGPVFLGSGQPVRKKPTGTGVFIPRRIEAHPEPHKNPPGAGIIMKRRDATMNQQSSSTRQEMLVTMVGRDVRFPTDWTY